MFFDVFLWWTRCVDRGSETLRKCQGATKEEKMSGPKSTEQQPGEETKEIHPCPNCADYVRTDLESRLKQSVKSEMGKRQRFWGWPERSGFVKGIKSLWRPYR
eukprot:g23681.t1